MIELTNGVRISEDRLIQKVTASVDSLTSTGGLEVMQYDDKMPVAAVTLTSKAVIWTPPEGAVLRVRMGKPDGYGVLNDVLGVDTEGTVYFAFTQQMTAANGTGGISIEMGVDGGIKSSAIVPVTIKKNPVQNDKIQSGDEYLALDAILEQVRQAAQDVTDNAAALQTLQDNAAALQTFHNNVEALQTLQENATAVQEAAANIEAIKAGPAAAATIQQHAEELQSLEENVDALNQVAANIDIIRSVPAASEAAVNASKTAGQYAEDTRQQAANASASADAAEQSAEAAAKSAEEAQKAAESTGVDDTTAGNKPWSAGKSVASFAPLASALTVSESGDGLVRLSPTAPWYLQGLRLFGKTTQEKTPGPESPVPLVNAGENGNVTMQITDGNGHAQQMLCPVHNDLPGIPVSDGGNYTDESGQQWLCDEVNFATGVYTRNLGVKTFDGTEAWSKTGTNVDRFFNSTANKGVVGFCNYFDRNKNGETAGGMSFNKTAMGFAYSAAGQTTVEQWKAWLREKNAAGTPLLVLYALTEPVTESISAETLTAYAGLQSYAGTTNIQADGCGVQAVAVADANTYFDQKIAEISSALLGG